MAGRLTRAASTAPDLGSPLGEAGRAMLRAAVREGHVSVTTDAAMRIARAAVTAGYLRADRRRVTVFLPTEAGAAFLDRLTRVE